MRVLVRRAPGRVRSDGLLVALLADLPPGLSGSPSTSAWPNEQAQPPEGRRCRRPGPPRCYSHRTRARAVPSAPTRRRRRAAAARGQGPTAEPRDLCPLRARDDFDRPLGRRHTVSCRLRPSTDDESAFFGGLFGRASTTVTRRPQAMSMSAPHSEPDAPAGDVLARPADHSAVFVRRHEFDPGAAHAPPAVRPVTAGNWWTLDCPERADEPTCATTSGRDGCPNPVSVVPGQTSTQTSRAAHHHLLNYCVHRRAHARDVPECDPGNMTRVGR